MKDIFQIPVRLPSLNEYINACRSNRYEAAKMKKQCEKILSFYMRNHACFHKPVFIRFTWIEQNKKRDLDNVAFGKKFILDAFVKYGILENDNWSHVTGFTDNFSVGNKPMIIVEITEVEA